MTAREKLRDALQEYVREETGDHDLVVVDYVACAASATMQTMDRAMHYATVSEGSAHGTIGLASILADSIEESAFGEEDL